MNGSPEIRTALLRSMMRIRVTEEMLAALYPQNQMRTPTHFSIGQEATAAGVSAALRPDDAVFSGHRCHAHYLAKGGDLQAMVSELFGKQGGCCGGRGGSVHLTDLKAGVVASSAILGETIAVAVGAAEAMSMNHQDRLAVTYFGDGAVEEGIFHESMNYATVRRLPVLFVCENNLYSVLTPLSCRQPAQVTIHERARGYGMPAQPVDGYDVCAVYAAARDAVAHIRSGRGPYLLECTTYRWREHVGPQWDYDWGYRSKSDVDAWVERCSIRTLKATLIADGVCTAEQVDQWEGELRTQVEKAVRVAQEDSFPPVETMMEGTY